MKYWRLRLWGSVLRGSPTEDRPVEFSHELLPSGVLGIALTGLVASFMAGMAANVSEFNTVFTYDIWRAYIVRGRPDTHYVTVGRWVTVAGVIGGIGTAFIAAAYSNIMNYMQSLFSFFNAPLFATFIVGLFWRRMTPWAGFWGLLLGTLTAMTSYVLDKAGVLAFGTDLNASFWGAGIAFAVDVLVSVAVSFRTTPKPEHELAGLVHGVHPAELRDDSLAGDDAWYRSPIPLGLGALALGIALYLPLR